MFTAIPPSEYVNDGKNFTAPRFGGDVAVKFATFAYTDTTAKALFTLPAGSVVIDYIADVQTVFNDSGTDLLIVGTSDNDDAYVDDLSGASLGRFRAGAGATTPITSLFNTPFARDTVIYGKFTGQNADATTGLVMVALFYIRKAS